MRIIIKMTPLVNDTLSGRTYRPYLATALLKCSKYVDFTFELMHGLVIVIRCKMNIPFYKFKNNNLPDLYYQTNIFVPPDVPIGEKDSSTIVNLS